MKRFFFTALVMVSTSALLAQAPKQGPPQPSGPQSDGAFRKIILVEDEVVDGQRRDTLKDPMEIAVAADGRVFIAERDGAVKVWKPGAKTTLMLAKFDVFTSGGKNLEDGLLGIALDPDFAKNNWLYLNRSLPEVTLDKDGKKQGIIRVSRFTLKGDALDLASEKALLDNVTQREQCCHVGGSLAFDKNGNLYISCGDNTNPFESDGCAPIDERRERSPWDAQKSSANANDLRGKINRIHPEPNGAYTIPKGNLFPPGTPGTRPEVYVMGNRNPFRISLDPKNGYLYWGEVGPDAGTPNEKRGPAGFDEINQARKAGFFGWPYFIADNRPYWHWDFEKKTNEFQFDPLKPVNNSPNNTGIKELPPAQPALIYYAHSPSTRFPEVNQVGPGGGGRTAMAGPVYYFDPKLKSEKKLPAEFDHTLFIYEWSRNWIIAVHLDKDENIAKDADGKPRMTRFCPQMTFKRPMDLELGADGCLYLIEWGTAWGNNLDTQIVRIEYDGTAARL
jgi:cytochrome c